MTNDYTEPAQRKLVHQLIDWKRIRSRYKRYSAIRRTFPLETMKKGCEKPPYYCHYMAWRLGTWTGESLFQRLEELLSCVELLPHWKHEKSLLSDPDFATFWSLVWQLQVAEHLCKVGKDVRWAKSGPDLSVVVGGERWYVECYTYRKSFALLNFLEELLERLDPTVCTEYDRCLPFQLPQGLDREPFLNNILFPFLDPAYLANAKEHAEQEYPVVLYEDPGSSLHIYVEGNDVNAYCPGRVLNSLGNPQFYVEQVLKEAVNAKKYSNDLENHHPNLLVVNYLLSADFQLAESLPTRMQSLNLPQIDPNIDALAVSAAGIDVQLTRGNLKVEMLAEGVKLRSLGRIASTSRHDSSDSNSS